MKIILTVLSLLFAAAVARAEDYTGRWGLGLDAGWAARTGSRAVRDTAGNGAALGASLSRGLDPHWRAALNYENIDLHGQRVEPITVSGVYAFTPERKWTPTAELGLGVSRGRHVLDTAGDGVNAAVKAAVGLEYSVCSAFSAGAKAAFYHVGRTSHAVGHEVDALTLGAGLSYWFGARKPQAARAEPAPAPKPAPVVAAAPAPAPKKVSISLDVQFETDKDVVRPQYDGKIKEVAQFLKSHPQATAEIEGHTDSAGSVEHNTGLSQRRADSVRRYLIENHGIDGKRLSAKGYGPTKPLADNATEAGRAQNRRVVATIDAQE